MRSLSPFLLLWLLTFLAACGGCSGATTVDDTTPGTDPESTTPEPTTVGNAVYDLHEWGVVAVRQGDVGSFELATGPGLRAIAMPMAVDKPVLYVHPVSDEPFDLDVRVTTGEGLSVAEHFPPTELSPALSWHARVEGTCRGTYPTDVDSRCPGGYCEISELGTYETTDAACLSVDGVRVPMLFYRLWAPSRPPAVPLTTAVHGDTVDVRNVGLREGVGALVRVVQSGTSTLAATVPMPAMGSQVSIPMPTANASSAHADMMRMLEARGLTRTEAQAFDRGWGSALFGTAASAVDGTPADVLPAVDAPAPVDRLSADEYLPSDDIPPNGPRDHDVLLYWLPDAQIEVYARVDATPAPRAFHRAFLVRQVLR